MADFSNVPGAYIARDGNWYGPDGSLLGPSDQAPNPAQASGTGVGAPPGPPVSQGPLDGSGTASAAPPAPAPSPTDWQGLQQQIFGSQPSVSQYTPPPFSYDAFTAPAAFSAPSGQDVLNADPGYQFRLDQGTGALQNSAAARGVLNTGGTLQDLINYGQGAASQEYGNAYARDLGTYQTNYQNALNSYVTNFGNALTKYNTNYNTNYLTPFTQLQAQYGNNVAGQNQLFGQQFATATA